jgi:hypothetical protein
MDQTTIFIILAVIVSIFIILREFNCWYWKINQRIELMKENNDLLRELISKMNSN